MALAPKPKTADGYSIAYAESCERVLVTLLSAFGTLKHTLRLVGGLVPRYLTPANPPDVPVHFGTSDVDIVLNLQLIAEGEGYASLSEQLKEKGFVRYEGPNGWSVAWRWVFNISDHEKVLVEFLQGASAEFPKGTKKPIEDEQVSALAIDHANIVHEWYEKKKICAELLDGGGISIETVHYADLVAFIILKALAFDDRIEPKDAGDLIYVMTYAGSTDEVAAKFIDRARSGLHPEAINAALEALQVRFCEGNEVEGYKLSGPVRYAQFILGKDEDSADARIELQRYASGLVTEIVGLIRKSFSKDEESAIASKA